MSEPVYESVREPTRIIKPGTQAKAGDHPLLVTEALIKPGCHIAYKCVWWDGATRHEGWLDACEVQGEAKHPISFHAGLATR